jgi:hypothetical protein
MYHNLREIQSLGTRLACYIEWPWIWRIFWQVSPFSFWILFELWYIENLHCATISGKTWWIELRMDSFTYETWNWCLQAISAASQYAEIPVREAVMLYTPLFTLILCLQDWKRVRSTNSSIVWESGLFGDFSRDIGRSSALYFTIDKIFRGLVEMTLK